MSELHIPPMRIGVFAEKRDAYLAWKAQDPLALAKADGRFRNTYVGMAPYRFWEWATRSDYGNWRGLRVRIGRFEAWFWRGRAGVW